MHQESPKTTDREAEMMEDGLKRGMKAVREREKKSKLASSRELEGGRGREMRRDRKNKGRVCGPGLSKGSCHIREAPLSTVPPL